MALAYFAHGHAPNVNVITSTPTLSHQHGHVPDVNVATPLTLMSGAWPHWSPGLPTIHIPGRPGLWIVAAAKSEASIRCQASAATSKPKVGICLPQAWKWLLQPDRGLS